MSKRINSISLRREKLEIISTILAIAQQPSTFYKLLSQATLSNDLLKKYLNLTLNCGLIEEQKIEKNTKQCSLILYCATEKGNRFLQLYCTNLMILYEELFFKKDSTFADAYLIRYCTKNITTLTPKLHPHINVFNREIMQTLEV